LGNPEAGDEVEGKIMKKVGLKMQPTFLDMNTT
jgi:hypothetical protein